MAAFVTVISSMATRQILSALVTAAHAAGLGAHITSIGGVDAAKRVRAGEVFDVVILASEAMHALATDGHVIGDSVRVFARSPTAVAVGSGTPHVGGCDEAALRGLIARANRIALSTGPSGVSIRRMLEAWGTADLERRLVVAPPGVPVARLLAEGQADVGFQQLSELLGEPGIDIVGSVPEALQPLTIFACGIGGKTTDAAAAEALILALVSEAAAATKRQYGMEP